MSGILENINQESQREIALSKALEKLTDLFTAITEFSNKELKSISLLQTNKYLKDLLSFYVLNKKHVKRKYAKEILKAFDLSTRDSTVNKKLLNRILENRFR